MDRRGGPLVTSHLVVAEPVARALAGGEPVVALETTLVTHGLPHPQGVEVALALEEAVRRGGAVPATIGILDGAIRVGLTPDELTRLATTPGVAKLNPGNLAAGLASGAPGSTTVAATIIAAHAAGIGVMATGGIGGVHRGEGGDVSADLVALSRVPVAVVCAGAKAILDLPRTVEMLETLGVPVFGFGTSEFPAFYRRSSGLPVDAMFEDLPALARAVRAHFDLAFGTGVVVANPIPEADELAAELYETALATALSEADARGIRGRAVTPFLLERIRVLTGGSSVRANVALLRHNASVAAALCRGVRS
ncbi:MAG: pseudouridine-5'-phosphate glycosidase [Acidobacteria bacterium]|nr:pseudouridine-5'-phosphate glycosidase [Acidobacteriota bacterium]